VPRHLARLVTWLVAPLIVDYFAYTARPGASARRAARRRLLRVRHASEYLGTSRGSSSTTAPTPHVWVPRAARRRLLRLARLVVDYCTYTARLSASAPHAAHCRSSSTTSPTTRVRVPQHVARLVVDYFAYATHPGTSAPRAARRRLLHLHRTSGCLGTSRGSSRRSSSTTSPTPRV
jgi:hypothetical protein